MLVQLALSDNEQ